MSCAGSMPFSLKVLRGNKISSTRDNKHFLILLQEMMKCLYDAKVKKCLFFGIVALLSFNINAQEVIKPDSKGFFHIRIRNGIYVISNMAWGGLAERGTATQNAQLIVGKKEALLIDTSLPKEGFANYVRSIADLPVIVVNSHGHFDHIGNNNQFDEIYIHPKDEELLRESFRRFGDVDFKIKYINDGDIINLGHRRVKVYNVPGHTKGSIVFLDKKTSTLITGDAIARRLFYSPSGGWTDMSDYFHAVERINKLQFDSILSNHDRFLISRYLGSRIKQAIIGNIATASKTWGFSGAEYLQILPETDQSSKTFLDISINKEKRDDVIRDLKQNGYMK
jgi:glyoxylase-like metal-dependent hydrolase (beta-lactamase superfamily II)